MKSHVERQTVSVTTAADGTATAYSANVTGWISTIAYQKVDFADGVDFTITLEKTGESLWVDTNVNASEVVRPVSEGNTGSTGAANGNPALPILAANDRVKIVIAQGGNAKSGNFVLVIA